MKKSKKGEIVIYVLALMLVTAGYFNYIEFDNKVQETYSEDLASEENQEYANIGDAVLVNSDAEDNMNNTIANNEENEKTNKIMENEEKENKEIKNNEEEQKNTEKKETANVNENENIKEAVNTEIAKKEEKDEYYIASKLERDKMYAEMISNYQNILNNEKISEVQKSIATEEIRKINNTKNAIMICENLILSKGFENCIIFVNNDSVNVVVKIENGLKKENVAKLQNIIEREMKTSIENIHISEK